MSSSTSSSSSPHPNQYYDINFNLIADQTPFKHPAKLATIVVENPFHQYIPLEFPIFPENFSIFNTDQAIYSGSIIQAIEKTSNIFKISRESPQENKTLQENKNIFYNHAVSFHNLLQFNPNAVKIFNQQLTLVLRDLQPTGTTPSPSNSEEPTPSSSSSSSSCSPAPSSSSSSSPSPANDGVDTTGSSAYHSYAYADFQEKVTHPGSKEILAITFKISYKWWEILRNIETGKQNSLIKQAIKNSSDYVREKTGTFFEDRVFTVYNRKQLTPYAMTIFNEQLSILLAREGLIDLSSEKFTEITNPASFDQHALGQISAQLQAVLPEEEPIVDASKDEQATQ